MAQRRLGRTGLHVSPLGFGAFKIGRNEQTKYPADYALPDEAAAATLLNTVLDLGVTYIDTAPSYGLSEERIGRAISHRRSEYVLSSKVGEQFIDGQSTYDFSSQAIRRSIQVSLKRLNTEVLDIVYIHSNGDDLHIINETDAVETLRDLVQAGLIASIGFSGKTVHGAEAALGWADVLMVAYSENDRSHEALIRQAAELDIGIVAKKGLASGHLPAQTAIPFVLGNRSVSSLVVGGLNADHLHANLDLASASVSTNST